MTAIQSAVCKTIRLAMVGVWLCALAAIASAAPAVTGTDDAAVAFRARYEALRGQLAASPFKRPMVLESQQGSNDVSGDVYAVIPHPFADVNTALGSAVTWCDILILHLNTKYCRVRQTSGTTTLQMNVGKKFDQPLGDSYRLTFAWRAAVQRADFLKVNLTADAGPLSTRDYRITLEALPLDGGNTFVHLSYAFGFSITGRLAMKAYLATIGRNKVGFTVMGKDARGQPVFVDGIRGLVERNTMRYHLAVEAYLGASTLAMASASAPAPRAQFEKRIVDWFAATELYPRQLHEMEQREYLDMKRREYQRQQADTGSAL